MTTTHIPFREVPYLPLKLKIDRRPDGTILLESGQPLKSYPPHMLAPLVSGQQSVRTRSGWPSAGRRTPRKPAGGK